MSIPLRQQLHIAKYLMLNKLRGNKRYPLILMLEPLYRCNLACAGCGKIAHPEEILDKRLTVDECLQAVDECGAPVVSIPGGEPLIHKEIVQIVDGIVARRKFVYLCTNALLLRKRLHEFTPSPYLAFSVHLDGLRERHDASVCRAGVFDKAVAAIKLALENGFRVNLNCTLFQNESSDEIAEFLDFVTELGVEGVTLSPGYSYSKAPQQEVFLARQQSKQLFRQLFAKPQRKQWRLNQSSLFIDFLCGNQDYQCTPWGSPARGVFGWQRPCYLLDEGYAPSFKALMEETDWEAYGTGRHPKCANCMVHCGYEPTAVQDAFSHPLKALRTSLLGPRTSGPMVAERLTSQRDMPTDEAGKPEVPDVQKEQRISIKIHDPDT